jgi:hypothetical protein
MEFMTNWSDEKDGHLEGPTFAAVEQAVEWAREQSDRVIVVLGFARPQVFSAGATYVAGEEVDAPLQAWPPHEDELARLLDDQDVPDTGWPSRGRPHG